MYEASAAVLAAMDTEPWQVLAGDTVLSEVELTAQWCASTFSLGNACAAGFTAKVAEDSLPFSRGDWVDLTAVVGEGSVPLGRFQLTQVKAVTDEGYFTLTGEDAMATALEAAFLSEEAECSAPALLEAIAEVCGLTVVGVELVPAVTVALTQEKTMRTLVGEIALLAGANARIDRTGALRLSRLEETTWALDPQRYYESELELDSGDYVLGALSVSDAETVYSAQLEGESRGLSFACDAYSQEAFDAVWAAWQGKRFRPGSAGFLGNLLLDPGDLIAVTDRAGNSYTLPVLEVKHRFDGGVRTTVTARVSEGECLAPQTVSQAISGLKLDLGRFRRLYADDLSATNADIRHLNLEVLKARTISVTGDDGTVVLKADADTGELVATKGTIGGATLSDSAITIPFRIDYTDYGDEAQEKVKQYILGNATLTDEELVAYDVNLDGRISGGDLLAMAKMQAGTNPTYAAGQLVIDSTDPRNCIRVEITEGYQAGRSVWMGLGGLYGRVVTAGTLVADSVTVNGENMVDYIVAYDSEESSDGVSWRWQKWHSGKAECWGKRNFGTVAITTAWGSLYESAQQGAAFPAGLFREAPDFLSIEFLGSNSGAAFIERGVGLSATSTGAFWLVKATAQASMTEATVGFHAIGRWK